MQTIKEKISANIAKYRKRKSFSKRFSCKIANQTIYCIKLGTGCKYPKCRMIVEMCNLFHISVDLMYGMSLADTKKAIESETIFWDYLLTLGYEVHESLIMINGLSV